MFDYFPFFQLFALEFKRKLVNLDHEIIILKN